MSFETFGCIHSEFYLGAGIKWININIGGIHDFVGVQLHKLELFSFFLNYANISNFFEKNFWKKGKVYLELTIENLIKELWRDELIVSDCNRIEANGNINGRMVYWTLNVS